MGSEMCIRDRSNKRAARTTSPTWNESASSLGNISTSYYAGTHQVPDGSAINIIGLSTNYIINNVADAGTATGNTSQSKRSIQHELDDVLVARSLEDISQRGSPSSILTKRAALECSAGSPCVDGSCCSKDGKCGYGPDYCGSGCLSNCTSTAMCGRYSLDSAVPCALQLCCSYYGWCGTEQQHCYDPEPQFGKVSKGLW